MQWLKSIYVQYPRVDLAHTPTPLEFAPRLTAELNGPRIWIKRDDCTGLAFGGNKARKLEFFMADALEKGADTIVTMGPTQSNHVRMTAAAAGKLGFGCHALLVGEETGAPMGNLFLDHLFGLTIHTISLALDDLPDGLVEKEIENIMGRLEHNGKKPYLVPPGGAGPLGELSYCLAMKEMNDQARELGITIDHVITPVGSQGTFSGLILGKMLLDLATGMIGISVDLPGTKESVGLPGIEQMVAEAGDLIGKKVTTASDAYELLYDYVGAGYGIPTPEGLEAIKRMAQLEGILLDPTYTGKSMAGLMDLVAQGRFGKDEVVVFLHTGGLPGLFNNTGIFKFPPNRTTMPADC